jgi:hypothetical protein
MGISDNFLGEPINGFGSVLVWVDSSQFLLVGWLAAISCFDHYFSRLIDLKVSRGLQRGNCEGVPGTQKDSKIFIRP